MIAYRQDKDVDLEALATLRASCDFADKPRAFLAQQIEGARWVVHAYEGARLVGFARAVSDGVSNAYVSSVMVHPGSRRRGVGRGMIERLVAGHTGIKFVLHARKDAAAFYAAVGFAPADDMLILRT
jgi:ribosomal protein S18 acetylase RimI-like enzyme